MIINSITLENFKSHKQSHIDLNEGISLILGENGAGKSSIFEAISYAFFKTYNGKIDEIIRKPSAENDIIKEMKVTVEFENNGNHYKLVRGKKNKTNIAKLFNTQNNDLSIICDGDKQVTNELEKLLEIDSKSFLNAVYIRQGDITELIDKSAAERKEFIAKLLNIDGLEKAWEELKTIIDIYKNKYANNEGKISNKEEVENYIKEITKDITKNQKALEEIIPSIKQLNDELAILEKNVKASDENKSTFNILNNEIANKKKLLNNIKEQINSAIEKIQDIENKEKACCNLKKYSETLPHLLNLKDLKNNSEIYTKELKEINITIDKINENNNILKDNEKFFNEYNSINKEIEELYGKRKELEKTVQKNQEIIIKLNDKESRKTDKLNYIRNISGHASKIFNKNFNNPEEVETTVIEEIEKTDNSINMLIKSINNNKESLASKNTELKNTKKSLKDLENTRDTCPICQSSISHEKHEELSQKYREQIISIEGRISDLEEANERQEPRLKKLEIFLDEINKINVERLKEEYDEFNNLSKEIKELKKLIPKVEDDEKLLNDIDNQINEKQDYQKTIEINKNDYIISLKTLEKLPDIEEEKEKHDKLNIKINDIKNQCRTIIQKYAVRDDIDKTIKYTQKQVDLFNQYQGEIKSKDTYMENRSNLENTLKTEEQELFELKNKKDNLNYNEEDNQKLHNNYLQKQNELETYQKNQTILDVTINKDKDQLEKREQELKDIEKIVLEQNNLKDYIKLLDDLREVYSKDGVQKDLRNNAKPDIEKETLDIFNEFDFEYSSLKLDEDYNITVENKQEKLELNMMSGGEKIVIALALRLGIARVVSKSRTELLLLDEPTIHLDEERRSKLIEIIRQISIVPQMIVVTHDDEMESLSNNIIKIKKSNGISYVDNN